MSEPVRPLEEELVEVRMLVPRTALVQTPPAPELISQANSLETFGLPPRRFLEIVRSPRFPGRVLRDGRLRLVHRADLLAHLERATAEATSAAGNGNDEQPAATAAGTLADRLGLEAVRRRTGAAR